MTASEYKSLTEEMHGLRTLVALPNYEDAGKTTACSDDDVCYDVLAEVASFKPCPPPRRQRKVPARAAKKTAAPPPPSKSDRRRLAFIEHDSADGGDEDVDEVAMPQPPAEHLRAIDFFFMLRTVDEADSPPPPNVKHSRKITMLLKRRDEEEAKERRRAATAAITVVPLGGASIVHVKRHGRTAKMPPPAYATTSAKKSTAVKRDAQIPYDPRVGIFDHKRARQEAIDRGDNYYTIEL